MAYQRRKMCRRGCVCDPCEEQRKIDRKYIESRSGDPLGYPSAQSAARRARKYGLDAVQLQKMHDDRKGLCDICGKEETVLGSTGKVKSLAVDHDHDTGRVRGLLCNNCNRGIGLLGKEPRLLRKALTYLEGCA